MDREEESEGYSNSQRKSNDRALRDKILLANLYGRNVRSSYVQERSRMQAKRIQHNPRPKSRASTDELLGIQAGIEHPEDRPSSPVRSPTRKAKPFFYGYSDTSSSVSAGSVRGAVKRYGYGGTLNLQKRNQNVNAKGIFPGYSSLNTEDMLPRFRGEDSLVDTYQPRLSGDMSRWSREATYVTGSSLRERPKSPELPESMKKAIQKQINDMDAYNTATIKEQPVVTPYDELTDPPISPIKKQTKYMFLPETTVVYGNDRKQSASDKVVELQILKWKEILSLLESLMNTSESTGETILRFLYHLKNAAAIPGVELSTTEYHASIEESNNEVNEHEKIVTRETGMYSKTLQRTNFVKAIRRVASGMNTSRANRMFTLVDYEMFGELDYRVFVGMMHLVSDSAYPTGSEKLEQVFDLMTRACDSDTISRSDLFSIFDTICNSRDDRDDFQFLVKLVFDKVPDGSIDRQTFMDALDTIDGYILVKKFESALEICLAMAFR